MTGLERSKLAVEARVSEASVRRYPHVSNNIAVRLQEASERTGIPLPPVDSSNSSKSDSPTPSRAA